MCGIMAYVGNSTHAPEVVFEGLKLLEYRGYDSWGIAFISNNKLLVEKHVGKIGNSQLKNLSNSKIAFAHTRWATHGGVTQTNAHPHYDCGKQIAVIHNGIVENYHSLKIKLLEKSHRFKSQTDTEIISHLVEENSKKMTIKDAVFATFKKLVGSNAICVIDLKSNSIIACRNGSPLVIGFDEKNNQYFLASDVPAFLKYTKEVYYLQDGQGCQISTNGVKIYDLKTNKEIKKIKKSIVDINFEDAKKGGYPHFLLKEINEQPKTILTSSQINKSIILEIAKIISKSKKIFFVGCGTAYYCALAAKYLFANIEIESQAFGAYEFLPFANFCDKNTTVVAISQSGETADTLIAVRVAKKNGAKIISVVNNRGSSLERISDFVLPVGAGPEIAVVSTKAFSAQLISIYLIAKTIQTNFESAKHVVEVISKKLSLFLSKQLTNKIILLSKKIVKSNHIFVIGKYINYSGALEFALKIKETSYIHAEGFSAGELKHGVITLIEKGTPCFILISNDSVKDEVLSSAAQLKARGGYIIGIGPFKSIEFDNLIETCDLGDMTVIANIIVGQLLGYYLGLARGTDPDKPRNLAKSVTVK